MASREWRARRPGSYRGARRARHPGTLHLLPFLAGRRSVDLGRAGDDAPRCGRLPPEGAPHHAADNRLSELIGGCSEVKKLRFFADRAAKMWPLRGSLKLGVG